MAWHLGHAFKKKGLRIEQIFSRNTKSGIQLADSLKARFAPTLKNLEAGSDLYILAVTDRSIEKIMMDWPEQLKNSLGVHTSGSVGLDSIRRFHAHAGVFYPLQTFSKAEKVKFKKIPICIEAGQKEDEEKLLKFGRVLSSDVRSLNSEQRRIAHLSAVFANNFTNYMYAIAAEILKNHDLPFDLIKPLIKKTANKQKKQDNPFRVQTGPAIRQDYGTIEKHLEMLKIKPDFQEIYELLSDKISVHKNGHKQTD